MRASKSAGGSSRSAAHERLVHSRRVLQAGHVGEQQQKLVEVFGHTNLRARKDGGGGHNESGRGDVNTRMSKALEHKRQGDGACTKSNASHILSTAFSW
eukprot:scaffold212250_cov28-Tisochrysis_lutea.AAC.2